jgi:DNA-binding NarL/FixJ family response regulator
MKKSVIIIENSKVVREQLVQLIGSAPDIKCLGTFASGEEALPVILKIKPDVVLMNIGLPQMSGVQYMAEIFPLNIQITMVTTHEDSESIFRAFKCGTNVYLIKSAAAEHLINAIKDACQCRAPLSSSVPRKTVRHVKRITYPAQESKNLSQREREVLDLLALGFIHREIGRKLGISVETVRTYVKSICKKMKVRRVIEAVGKYCSSSSN